MIKGLIIIIIIIFIIIIIIIIFIIVISGKRSVWNNAVYITHFLRATQFFGQAFGCLS